MNDVEKGLVDSSLPQLYTRLAAFLLILTVTLASLVPTYAQPRHDGAPFSKIFLEQEQEGSDQTTPRGVHLSSQKDPARSVTISWYTLASAESVAEYGTTFPPNKAVTGKTTKSPVSSLQLHEVELTDLTPGTTYFYRVGDPGKGWSEHHKFMTAPLDLRRFNFTVWGDQGTTSDEALSVVTGARELRPSFHLHTGDLAYAGGNENTLNRWFDLIQPLASEALYFPAVGNHEYEADPDLRNFFLPRFALPDDERSYSIRWGNALILTVDFGPNQNNPKTDAIPWLKATLDRAAKDQSITWRIIFIHYPLYSTYYRDTQSVRNILQPILDNYNVDLLLAGHDHFYERSYPIRGDCIASKNQTEYVLDSATIQVTTGGAGGSLYQSAAGTPPNWQKTQASVFHFLWIEVAGNTLAVKAIRTTDGSTLDQLTATKSPTASQTCVEKVSTTTAATTQQTVTSLVLTTPETRQETANLWPATTVIIAATILLIIAAVLVMRRWTQRKN